MDAGKRISDAYRPKSATEAQIVAVAGRQLHLISVRQLLAAGIAERSIARRAESCRLFRLIRGVYALHPPPYSREQRWMAAVLACGPGSLLSDWPAAAHWGITDHPLTLAPHVTVSAGSGRCRDGITAHQRGPIDPRDVRIKDSVPVTSVDLVLVHLAPQVGIGELERMLVAAESLGLLKRNRLLELVRQRHGRPGMHKLRSIMALEPVRARSDLELDFLPVWRASGLPRPLVNHPITVPGRTQPLLVDFAWPGLRLAVECDSQRFHGDWERAEADRERDQLLALAGWVSHRFVRRRIVEDPSGSAQRLRALAEVRRLELAR